MKIISYNVNGIRAAVTKGFDKWLTAENPDIICIQEIKALQEQVVTTFLDTLGYHHFWFSAQKKGYSGVAVFSKQKPDFVQLGMNNPIHDFEGRLIRCDFGDITHITAYFPSGTSGDERQKYKYIFLNDFEKYIQELKKSRPNIIISGDVNIAHTEIDINNPKRNSQTSGFLPDERAWVTKFLENGFIDSFRVFNSQPHQYSWWTYRANAREKNIGWRIDYHFVSESLRNRLTSASILNDVFHSDHCPIVVEIS